MNNDPQNSGADRRPSSMLGAGIAIGAGFGVALGLTLDNLALGIAMGVAIGTALGAAMARRDGVGLDDEALDGRQRVMILAGIGGLLLLVAVGVVVLLLLGLR